MQTLLARLKAETRIQHLRLERELDMLGEGGSRSAHRELLRRLYGFYRPWEERAVPVLERGHPGLTAGRSKVALLEHDLAFFGESPSAIRALPSCPTLPALDTMPAALGSMYVVEGATLGGQIVSRHLAVALGIEPGRGTAFFGSYGAEVGPMWRRFGDALAAHAGFEDGRIVAAAQETFERLHRWILPRGGEPA